MNRKTLAFVLPGLGLLGLAVGIVAYARRAEAAPGIHTPASICRPKNYQQGKDFSYGSGAIVRNENTTSSKSINCAVMADVAGLGDLVVRMVGVDNSTTDWVTCTFTTFNSSNNQVWTAGQTSFDTTAQTGAFNRAFATGPVNDHDFYRHYVNCSIPKRVGTSRSGLYGIRVQ